MSSRHSKAKSDHKEEEEIFVAAGKMRRQNEQNTSNPSSSLFDPVTSDFPQPPETSNQFGNQLSANEIEHPHRIIPNLSTSVLHPVTLEVPKLLQSRHSKAKSDHKKEEAIFVAAGMMKTQNEQNTLNQSSSLFDQGTSDVFQLPESSNFPRSSQPWEQLDQPYQNLQESSFSYADPARPTVGNDFWIDMTNDNEESFSQHGVTMNQYAGSGTHLPSNQMDPLSSFGQVPPDNFGQEPPEDFAQAFQQPEHNIPHSKQTRKRTIKGPPSSAFVLFHREQEELLRIENPESTYNERRQKIGWVWKKELDQDTKKEYEERCSLMNEDFYMKENDGMYEKQQRALVGILPQAATSSHSGRPAKSRNPPAPKPMKIKLNPVPPKTAYELFRREHDERLKKLNPEGDYNQRRRDIGELWKKVDSDTKQGYERTVIEMNRKYEEIEKDRNNEELERMLVGSSYQMSQGEAENQMPPVEAEKFLPTTSSKKRRDVLDPSHISLFSPIRNPVDQPRHVPISIRKRKSEDSPGPSTQKRSAGMDTFDFSQLSLAKDPAEVQFEEPFEESEENSFEEEEEY